MMLKAHTPHAETRKMFPPDDRARRLRPIAPGVDAPPFPGLSSAGVERRLPAVPASRLELRQIAGLTAGATFAFHDDQLRMGLAPHTVGFELVTAPDGTTTLVPGVSPVRVDGILVTAPMRIDDRTIDAGNARFVLAPPAAATTQRRTRIHFDDDPVIAVGDDDELSRRVRSARRVVETARRRAHPDPSDLLRTASGAGPLRWSRRRGDRRFATVGLALADLAWTPRFDRPERLSEAAAATIAPLRRLDAVPVEADLRTGPLAIIGSRPARLAIARHLAVALATLSPADDLELAVLADREHAGDWQWADLLPHATAGADHAMPVLFVDGPDQIDRSLGEALSESSGIGTVFLGDDVTTVPMTCAMTMIVNDDHTATVIDHIAETTITGATPLGLTEPVAEGAARALREASRPRSPAALALG